MSKDFDPSPWFPETNPVRLAILGKALEELFELAPLLAHPVPRKDASTPEQIKHLAEELADVEATLVLIVRHFELVLPIDPNSTELEKALLNRQAILFDLGKTISRVIIQGIAENEPRTAEPNRLMLARHVDRMLRVIYRLVAAPVYGIDSKFVAERSGKKIAYLTKWHENMQADLDRQERDRDLDAKAHAEYQDRWDD